MKDRIGREIKVGQILRSSHGYLVLVCKDRQTGELYGSLICSVEHSCRTARYDLGTGQEYEFTGLITAVG